MVNNNKVVLIKQKANNYVLDKIRAADLYGDLLQLCQKLRILIRT